MVGITLLKFNLAEASLTVCPLSPLPGPALLIYHDWLPTLTAMNHFLVRRNEHGAAVPGQFEEPGYRRKYLGDKRSV